MRFLVVATVIAILSFQKTYAACLDVSREEFARALATAYASSTLSSLDSQYKELAPFQIYIEHSIIEEDNGSPIFVTAASSFQDLENILKSRQVDGFPTPNSRPLRKCGNGVCSYNFLIGIQHNNLYLYELRYNDYVKCLQVETIWFLDGD